MTRDEILRRLPAVHELAAAASALAAAPRWAVVEAARRVVAERRAAILAGEDPTEVTAAEVAAAADALALPTLRRVVNATGVVLHTNLGRAPLAAAARAAIDDIAGGYATLEYDVESGERGSRHLHAAALLRDLTGAEDAVVVNNNAAACVLALSALAAGREVVVSRGELVEIGGSFRVPEILRTSGCRLVEVGATNKTRLSDYESAIGDATAMLLKVHPSNFAVIGFTESVDAADVATLARRRGVLSMMDLGSGALLPSATQRALGLPAEPSVPEVVASGIDLATFSGDKLLGGPQAGVLVGRADIIARCRSHPLMRAVRPDKLTLAALSATLALYRDGGENEIPVIAMLSTPNATLHQRAVQLAIACGGVDVVRCSSAVGGGAMPLASLGSWALSLPASADVGLRAATMPVIGRIADNRLLLDVRTIAPSDEPAVVTAVRALRV